VCWPFGVATTPDIHGELIMVEKIQRRGLLLACGMAAALLTSHQALAQQSASWPNRTVRIVVPFAPGGSADVAARFLAPRLSARLGQQVVVENRPGAGGTLAVGQVAKGASDGHTLLLAAAGALTISPHLMKGLPYDPVSDLAPVSGFARIPLVLIANAAVPAQTPADLIRLIRSQPGRFSYATTGNGSAMHLAGESFKALTESFIVHIPYRGSAPAVAAVMSGEVELAIVDLTSVVGRADSGRFRNVALMGRERSALAPSLPTLAEAGLADLDVSGWFGLFAPVGMPAAVIERLNTEITAQLRAEDLKERFKAVGIEPMPTTPDALAAFMKREFTNFGQVIRRAEIRAD
jgi:tripartite-type tricarboxylate transporter receptor subunit TctC